MENQNSQKTTQTFKILNHGIKKIRKKSQDQDILQVHQEQVKATVHFYWQKD
jgi:hypothetical protein